jgi:membrane-bound lytic murein transglycosylase MltF
MSGEAPIPHPRVIVWLLVLGLLFCIATDAGAQEASEALPPDELTAAEEAEVDALALPLPVPRLGDFDVMKEARLIRVLVPYSKTLYFVDRGRELGIEHDLGVAFEEWLAKKHGRKPSPIRIAFVPTARDKLLPNLVEGLGDIAAGGITVTPDRQAIVDFAAPIASGVREIVVTGPASPALATIDDLAGQEIMVRRSSSYYEHLAALSQSFEARGLAPINLREADEDLEDEDLLEMLHAGLLPLVVVDRYKANFWIQVFETITSREDLVVNQGGDIAWAIRKDSPLLAAEIAAFIKEHKVGTAFGNTVIKKYLKSTKYVKNPNAEEQMAKFLATVEIFKKYADIYKFDYLMLLARRGRDHAAPAQHRRRPLGRHRGHRRERGQQHPCRRQISQPAA